MPAFTLIVVIFYLMVAKPLRRRMKAAYGRMTFPMPAPRAAAFEAFFNHEVRLQWDTLLKVNYVEGGGTHPYVGAISTNIGRGWKSWLRMRTRFLTYDPPRRLQPRWWNRAVPSRYGRPRCVLTNDRTGTATLSIPTLSACDRGGSARHSIR